MLLQLQNTILEMVARGESLVSTADRLCLEVEKLLPEVICSILRVDRGHLYPLASPSLPIHYSNAIEGTRIGPDIGSCGAAAYLRKPVVTTDIGSDPHWSQFKNLVLPLGLKACWSSPFCSGTGRALGTFAFYYREKRPPSEFERQIVETCAHLCTIAVERHQRVLERELKTYTDALTKLANRASFDLKLSRIATKRTDLWGILLLDLDNLKIINDTFGHLAGDRLLQIAGERIAGNARPHSAYRLSGDEFAVIIEGKAAASTIETTAFRIRDALSQPADCQQHRLVPTATIGAAVAQTVTSAPEEVHRNADLALYHAKETDRGGFVRYSPNLGTAMTRRVNAIRDVGVALGEGRIDAHYQPIVHLDTQAIVGVEALCRLTTHSGQLVPAAAFFEATSDARIASQLTRRMVEVVAADVRRWLEMGIPFQHVGINVSSADFHGGELDAFLTAAFGRENVPLKHVVLEVTESVYMRRQDRIVSRAIQAMRAKGLRIALDDFGTGFASLTDLLTVPVDILKIDKSFVDRLTPGDASGVIVEGLIGIATKLGIEIVAEGVETESQASQLRRFGCELGQGYLFAKPAPREAVTAMLLRSAQTPADILNAISRAHRPPPRSTVHSSVGETGEQRQMLRA